MRRLPRGFMMDKKGLPVRLPERRGRLRTGGEYRPPAVTRQWARFPGTYNSSNSRYITWPSILTYLPKSSKVAFPAFLAASRIVYRHGHKTSCVKRVTCAEAWWTEAGQCPGMTRMRGAVTIYRYSMPAYLFVIPGEIPICDDCFFPGKNVISRTIPISCFNVGAR